MKKLFNEVKANHISAVKKILRENKNLNLDVKDSSNETVLMRASIFGQEGCVRTLLEAGADPNIKDDYGYTALIFASINGHDSCVRALLEYNTNTDIRNHVGNTVLIYASENGYEGCFKLLIDAGAKIDIKNKYSKTALMEALLKGHDSCVIALLEGGADPYIKNKKGKTALDLTTNENIKKMLKKAMAFKKMLPFFVKKKLPKSLHLNTELLRLTTEYLFSRKRSKKRSKKNIR